MKTEAFDCSLTSELAEAYVEGKLPQQQTAELKTHLETCAACSESVKCLRDVSSLLRYIDSGAEQAAPIAESVGSRPFAALSAVPWWGVSIALHGLVIALAGLVSMVVSLPPPEDPCITVTELVARPPALAEEKQAEDLNRSVLASKHETPPTDYTSKEMSNVVIPPELVARAEIGEHFETVNPDRPDTQSAFGNPESESFHSASGDDSPAGGGGNDGAVLEDMIGVGGAASVGSGGGSGGGFGTGTGVGTGPGHGTFGNRNGGGRKLMIKRFGGSKQTEGAVDKALEWLAKNQEADGHWDTAKHADNKAYRYGAGAGLPPTCDPGVTGLATLAFLGAGHSFRVGAYKANVQNAVKWLLKQQGPDGNFSAHHVHYLTGCYNHCIATLACAEALGMNNGKDWGGGDSSSDAKGERSLRAAVEKGVELLLKWQSMNPQGGWSYPPTAPVDPTVSGWAIMALKSAKIAGVHVPADAFQKAQDALETLTTVDHRKGGPYGAGYVGYRLKDAKPFNMRGYGCTAAGAVIELFLGKMADDPSVQAKIATITQPEALPDYIFKPEDVNTDHQGYYYWYYGTLACFQEGGEAWKKWNEKLKAALVPNQRRDGAFDGSWDPYDVCGQTGGRVYSTAIGALSLEVYYRYQKLQNDH